jgi:hypothetical protein
MVVMALFNSYNPPHNIPQEIAHRVFCGDAFLEFPMKMPGLTALAGTFGASELLQGRAVAGYELVGHAEKVSQHIGVNGRLEGVILNESEAAWLHSCWLATAKRH